MVFQALEVPRLQLAAQMSASELLALSQRPDYLVVAEPNDEDNLPFTPDEYTLFMRSLLMTVTEISSDEDADLKRYTNYTFKRETVGDQFYIYGSPQIFTAQEYFAQRGQQ